MLPFDPEILRMMIGSQLANQEIRNELLANVTTWLEGKNVESVDLWDTHAECFVSTSSAHETAQLLLGILAGEFGVQFAEFIYPWEVENPQIFAS